MKINITILSLAIALFWACSASKTSTNIANDNLDDSPYVTGRTLPNFISSIPRLDVRGSGSNVQVYNSAVSTIKNDTRPLFILDGIQVGRDFSRVISMIDENQALIVNFMKISRATIRYGESGRNGVVLISFKQQ